MVVSFFGSPHLLYDGSPYSFLGFLEAAAQLARHWWLISHAQCHKRDADGAPYRRPLNTQHLACWELSRLASDHAQSTPSSACARGLWRK